MLFTFLDQDKIGAPATYRQVLAQPHFRLVYSEDGINFTEIDWAGEYIEGYAYVENVSWPVFRVWNSTPIGGNAKYLRVTLDPQSAPTARAFDPLLVSYKDDYTEMQTVTLYRTAIENGQNLRLDGVSETVTGVSERYIVGENINYKQSEIVWSVKKDGAATSEASVDSNGVFQANASGTYEITAVITSGNATASGRVTVTAIAPIPEQIAIESRDSFNNGDNFNFEITVRDQKGNSYHPDDLTWTIEQVQKGEGSADFAKLTGNALSITDRIQLNFYGTLKITVRAGGIVEEKTIAVGKVSQIVELKVEGAETMKAGEKISLEIKAIDQYGAEIENLSTCRWTIEGEGFSRVTGSGKTITIDLSKKAEFVGKLNISVNARMNDLFDFTTASREVKVEAAASEDMGKKKGCFGTVSGATLLASAIALGGAVLVGKKRRK